MTKLPTNAPIKLPTPPRITTISASGIMSPSSPGYAERMGPPMTPPAPASAEPRQNTTVKSRETGTPTARAMSRSSTPARIIAPRRVRSRSRYKPMPASTAIATTTSRYAGKASPARSTGRCNTRGVGTGIGSPPHTTRQKSARMFSVWRTQYCRSGLQIVRGREVARIDRALEKLLRLIGPELAHVGIGVDDLVHQPSLLARDAADVDVAHHVPVLVERDRAAAGVHLDGADGLHESRFVLDVSADRVQRGLQHSGLGVGRRSVEARIVFPFFAKARGKLFVDGVVDLRRVPAGGD